MVSIQSFFSPGQTLYDCLSTAEKQQFCLLNEAEKNLTLILAGILIQFKVIHLQRGLLLDRVLCPSFYQQREYPDPFFLQLVASLIVLYALFGFYRQAETAAELAREEGAVPYAQHIEVFLSGAVIVVALIRLALLLQRQFAASSTLAASETLDV